jgi:5-methylcytosine-specific restriction endonuclease McrA
MTGRSWEGGSTRAWRKLRAAILERDNEQCQLRIEGVCTGHATHVHHTLGKTVTGDDPRYLVAACADCNLKTGEPGKHDPQPQPRTRW